MNVSQELTRLLASSKTLKCGLAFVIVLASLGQLRLATQCCRDPTTAADRPIGITTIDATTNSIAPGELPGYTGWGRPENSLARYFSIQSISATTAAPPDSLGTREYNYVVTVKCQGHKDCVSGKQPTRQTGSNQNKDHSESTCASWFYLRAYGPAVVPGTVTPRECDADLGSSGGGCCYDINFAFYDPGLYTIEAVLTVSSPPPVSAFPLGGGIAEADVPFYEGYLLPGFPLLATVAFESEEMTNPQILRHNNNKSTKSIQLRDGAVNLDDLCSFEDLVETSPMSAMSKARWRVTGKVNDRKYSSKTMNSPIVSTIGYVDNENSLGINMEYRYRNDCLILPESSFNKGPVPRRPMAVGQCDGPQKKVHIVYVGDSLLRLQKVMLQELLKDIPTDRAEFSLLQLHGGYRKVQKQGGKEGMNVKTFFNDLKMKTKDAGNDETIVILFNTGMHDIHNLCSAKFSDDRKTYLDMDRLESGTFSCAEEYRALLRDFLDMVNDFPAALKVFQSTTAAWPKYGNWGFQWQQNGEDMNLISDFCAAFNEIAFEVLADYKDSDIHVMDGYWITYPRPDNRQIGMGSETRESNIGKKLSHPGVEVLSVMVRKWVMLMLDRICLPM